MRKELLTDINEVVAKKYLREGVGKHPPCPKCQRKKYIKRLKGADKRYHCSKCRHKFSLKGIIGFKNSNLEYKQIFLVIKCFSSNKTHKDVIDWTGISYPSSRFNYSRIRSSLVPHLPMGKVSGHFVVDESFVGRAKHDNQSIVIGAVDTTFTELRLEIIPDRSQSSIEGFLDRHIETDSLLSTDAFSSYYGVEYLGYAHNIDNHDRGELKNTVPIERVWALFKTFYRRSYHHINKEKLQEYLVEFQFKFIHRKNRDNPLYIAKILAKTVPNC